MAFFRYDVMSFSALSKRSFRAMFSSRKASAALFSSSVSSFSIVFVVWLSLDVDLCTGSIVFERLSSCVGFDVASSVFTSTTSIFFVFSLSLSLSLSFSRSFRSFLSFLSFLSSFGLDFERLDGSLPGAAGAVIVDRFGLDDLERLRSTYVSVPELQSSRSSTIRKDAIDHAKCPI